MIFLLKYRPTSRYIMKTLDKKEIAQNKILDAAYEVFVGKGYSDTTMDDIVKKSEMSKGAIYHYYSSKKALFLALIDHWETYSFPDFYTKKKNKSASEILKDITDVVYDVYKTKNMYFLLKLSFGHLPIRIMKLRISLKFYMKSFFFI